MDIDEGTEGTGPPSDEEVESKLRFSGGDLGGGAANPRVNLENGEGRK